MPESTKASLKRRVLRQRWGEFPVCPAEYESAVKRRLFPRRCLERMLGTRAFSAESEARWRRLRDRAAHLDAARRLALHRAALTVIGELDEQYPWDQYSSHSPGGLFEEAFAEYFSVPWMESGIDLDTYVRDAVELVVWRDYGLVFGRPHLFDAIPRDQGDRVAALLGSIRKELRARRYRVQERDLLRLWASFVVTHERFDDFVPLAREIGSDRCIPSVQMLAEVALGEEREELALAVFGAANQPGKGQAFLISECRRLLGRHPPADVTRPQESARRRGRRRKLGGRYTLLSVRASTAMYAVWKAVDEQTRRTVAIKLVLPEPRHPSGDAAPVWEAPARLRHESDILARLDHPAVVRRLSSSGLRASQPYLVLEYIDGSSLAMSSRMTPVEAVRFMLPLADALARAHARGILHRDIKPDNVLCARGPDGELLPKLVDFGLSSSDLPSTIVDPPGFTVGTPGYMSPEQVAADPLDARADVWSFCVTLYEAISGKEAFRGEDDPYVMAIALCCNPPSLAELGAADQELARIVLKGMYHSREARWASMGELGQALARWLLTAGVDVDPYGVPVAGWLSPLRRTTRRARPRPARARSPA